MDTFRITALLDRRLLAMDTRDRDTGAPQRVFHGLFGPAWHESLDGTARALLRHEVEESLLFRGVRIWDPHDPYRDFGHLCRDVGIDQVPRFLESRILPLTVRWIVAHACPWAPVIEVGLWGRHEVVTVHHLDTVPDLLGRIRAAACGLAATAYAAERVEPGPDPRGDLMLFEMPMD